MSDCESEDVSDIDQLDGNVSVCSSIIQNDPQSCKKLSDHLKPKNAKKIDKIAAALNLPIVATYNLRSMIPKLKSLKIDILERSVDLGFLQEIWEQEDNKDHQFEIEKMLEMDGFQYISTPRPKNSKGRSYGGCSNCY